MSSRTRGQLKNVAASVRQRLYDRSRTRGEDFQLTLIQYALERLLYRLSRSVHRDRFVLKGALLFTVWEGVPYRATRDLDLLGRGDNRVEVMVQAFRDICRTPVESDGLEFAADKIRGEEIRGEQEYEGVRLTFHAGLAEARIPIQVDIGFGDTVVPRPDPIEYPTMLDLPAPKVLGYPREVVIAEKYQAMVRLGVTNSRMKDFYDLWFLSQQFACDGGRLCEAIRSTFERRQTTPPVGTPLALSSEFYNDREKQTQWTGFLKRSGLNPTDFSLPDVCGTLEHFLLPPTVAVAKKQSFKEHWPAGGPWSQ